MHNGQEYAKTGKSTSPARTGCLISSVEVSNLYPVMFALIGTKFNGGKMMIVIPPVLFTMRVYA